MFRTIVVGCDGSERTTDAVALALQLRHPEGRLLLAAVQPEFAAWPERAGGYHYSQYMGERCAEDLAAAAKAIPESVPVERQVLSDDSPAAALDGFAAVANADLVVLGSTHHKRLGKLTGRTVAQRMLQAAPCAVAVAAPDQADRFARAPRICVAYDGSAESQYALAAAYDVAQGTGGTVTLLRVVEPIIYPSTYAPVANDLELESDIRIKAEEAMKEVTDRAPDSAIVEARLLLGPVAKSILDFAADDYDLLVVGSRHYGPAHRVLAGSVSAHALTDGRVPVLVTPRGATGAVPAAPSTEEAAVS